MVALNKKLNRRKLLETIVKTRRDLAHRFDLREDMAAVNEIAEELKRGIDFRGANLWILFFAALIASIGLNLNSSAVIIGAMLISPLMGPILGIGFGVGTNDLEIIKKSLKNLGFAVGVSLVASTLYFLLSPLTDAQSELLARTSPTLWDVLIALFGGSAGIIGASRQSKGNVIPGVAIATALMPPLCTAGYSLAAWNWTYFAGAAYLFFINSVFICASTYLMIRLMKFPKKHFLDLDLDLRMKRTIFILVLITTIPSIFLATSLVKEGVFVKNAKAFVDKEFHFENVQILEQNFDFRAQPRRIVLSLIGAEVKREDTHRLEEKLKNYALEGTELVLKQGISLGSQAETLTALRSGIIEELYKNNETALKNRDERIRFLEEEVVSLKENIVDQDLIFKELKAQEPNLTQLYLAKATALQVLLVYARFSKSPGRQTIQRIERWLKVRMNVKDVKISLETRRS